ncbi:MAG: hypothetical protein ACFCUP_16805, partial [Actinomycetales bacterium]
MTSDPDGSRPSSRAAANPGGGPQPGWRGRRRRRTAIVAGTGVAALAAAGAVAVGVGTPRAAAAELTPFESCESLTDWYAEQARERVGAWGLDGVPQVDLSVVAEGGPVRRQAPGTGAERAAAAPDGAPGEAAAV